MKYQLLNNKLEIIKSFKTQKELLKYCDKLQNFGKGFFIFNTKTNKSIQLV